GVSFIGWHQRTRLERALMVIAAVLFVAVLLTITLLLTMRGPSYLPVPPCYQPETRDQAVCLKGSCIYTASEVIRALDETQDPCEDFYEFACGGWIKNNPIPEGKSSWGIFSKIELQNQYNLGGLFNWAVTEDDRNSSKHVIVVLDAYLDYMTRICVLLGANRTEARAQMNKVILFETELANITTPSEDRRDEEGLYNPYTIRQWQKEVPFMNWTMFFNDAFKLVNRTIPDTERIVVYAPETLTSYMMWQVSRSLSTYLSKSFRDATKILRKALFGSEGTEESWRYCVTDTNNAVGFAVGAMFVREVFHGEAKTQGEIMINNIRNAFKRNLKNLDWMDAETRKAAEIKADAITDMIGMTPSTVNAYYTPTKNQIVFPAGILQLPFYDGDNPKGVNYGAMGVVMGHELTHAFDDQGREYDRFKRRAKCFQEQYSNYSVDGVRLNGKQTLGENIADNGGLKASFHAYLDYSRTAKVNLTLPGLKYNDRQLFFISFAQDDHTTAKYRVIGPIANLKEFSEEFNCPIGSKMNPRDKCEVW
ncbi:hypothetical protein HF086_010852, partial [Spodoptera exigua]